MAKAEAASVGDDGSCAEFKMAIITPPKEIDFKMIIIPAPKELDRAMVINPCATSSSAATAPQIIVPQRRETNEQLTPPLFMINVKPSQ